MEIAYIFVVKKSDRPGADTFVKNLRLMLAPAFTHHATEVKVIKTVASTHSGITDLYTAILQQLQAGLTNDKKAWLLAEKAYFLIQQKRMKGILKESLQQAIRQQLQGNDFNLYRFIQPYL